MRHILLCIFILVLVSGIDHIKAQSEDPLTHNIVKGVADLRSDIFLRKQAYIKEINDLIIRLDSSSISEDQKKASHEFIKQDIQTGGLINSLELYDLMPKNSPFRNIYIQQYIANNQDYQIDKGFVFELTTAGVLTKDGKIGRSKLEELKKDFNFLSIQKNDRLLLYNASGAAYAILLGYAFEDVDMTIHNQYLDNHYLALDRADRYPNINNGNSIEFLHQQDNRITVDLEQWDKIIIRVSNILERGAGPILKSFHDNLSEKGHLYIFHQVASDQNNCDGQLTEEDIIKITNRYDFNLIDKLEMGCLTYFKFQSIKE